MRFVWCLGCLVALIVLLAGCEGGNTPPAQPREGQQVPILREFRGQQGPFPDRGLFVVQRPEIWEALWAGRTAPDVDFSRQSVLVALMGEQRTAGYDIQITDVRATGQRIVAYVTETRPKPAQGTAQVLTYPYHMVVVPRLLQPVTFMVNGVATPVTPILDALQGIQSNAVNAQTAVIRDQAAWSKFWQDNFGAAVAVPTVDFTQNMTVAVFLGQRATSGYTVMITSVEQVGNQLVVNYRTRVPQPGEAVTPTRTSPYAIAIIPSSTLPVVFRNVVPPPATP